METSKQQAGDGKAQIDLPVEVRDLLDKTIFDLDEQVDPDYLNKYLFYMPEVIRLFGLAIAEVKREVREAEIELAGIRNDRLMELAVDTFAHQFKNEQMRTAYVESDLNFRKKEKEIVLKEYQMNKLIEEVRKYKNLMMSLDNISKLRISERRY